MPNVRILLQSLADALSPNTGTSDGFVDNVETSLARISQALPEILGGKIEVESLADEYDDQATYDIGDYCTHDGVLYICATAVATDESWDSAKWVAVPLIEILQEKLDAPATGAVAGRYLMVGQNGEPVWDQLDESDIRQSVYDWLSAHPEAIVVNDGTITRAKLDSSVGQAVDEVSELKADFLQSLIYDTASGSVATFPDGAHELPCKSVVAQIVPKQAGSGDPSPDNVRPISGWDAVNVTRNAGDYATMDSVLNNSVLDSSGAVVYENRMVTTDYMPVSQGDEVRYYLVSKEGARARCVVAYNADKTFNSILFESSWITVNSVVERTFTIASGIAYVRACYYSGDTDKSFVNKTLENTYSVNLPQTVYGGEVDVVSGEGKVTYGMVDLGTLTWSAFSTDTAGKNRFMADVPGLKIGDYTKVKLICSEYKEIGLTVTYGLCGVAPHGTVAKVVVADPVRAEMTGAEFKSAMSGVLLVYELATPTDFSVTPQEVSTLYGSNTVYADSGDVSVEYPADTKLYISRLTGPDSADMIADANIVSGKYFMVGNDLYLATSNIANGGSIIPGTNCTKVSLATALNAINS